MKDRTEKLMIPGLALEGGAMRGMYTAGVLDTFLDEGIGAEEIVGVSAGALFGANYVSGQKGRTIRYNKRFNRDRTYMGLIPLLLEGNLINTEYAYERVPHKLDPFDDEAFKASPSRFYAVATNLQTGRAEYMRVNSVFAQMDILRASGSMPFVSKPVELNGALYLDGGIADSIPYEWLLNRGVEKIVAVLTRDASYVDKPDKLLPIRYYKRKYPALAESLLHLDTMYNNQLQELARLEQEGRVFVIRPSVPIGISRIERNPKKLQAVYELGQRDAAAAMDRLRDYLCR